MTHWVFAVYQIIQKGKKTAPSKTSDRKQPAKYIHRTSVTNTKGRKL